MPPSPRALRVPVLLLLLAAPAPFVAVDVYGGKRSSTARTELREWMDSQGYSRAAPKVEARDGGLFVRAGTNVSPGEEIVAIPPSLVLLPGLVFGSSDMPVALQMLLCFERHRPDSTYGPYLRSLPDSFELPFLWPAAERRALRPSWLAADVEADIAMVNRTHMQYMMPFCARLSLQQAISAGDICSLSTWQWAWGVVWSRALGIPEEAVVEATETPASHLPASTAATTSGLIPLLDMANHRSGSPVRSSWDSKRRLLSVMSTAALQGGQEVFIDYNHEWSSAEFLRGYGLVPNRSSIGGGGDQEGEQFECATMPTELLLLTENDAANSSASEGSEGRLAITCLLAMLIRSEVRPEMQFDIPVPYTYTGAPTYSGDKCGVSLPDSLRISHPGHQEHGSLILRLLLLIGAAHALTAAEASTMWTQAADAERQQSDIIEGATSTTVRNGGALVAQQLREMIGHERGGRRRVLALRHVLALVTRWEQWHEAERESALRMCSSPGAFPSSTVRDVGIDSSDTTAPVPSVDPGGAMDPSRRRGYWFACAAKVAEAEKSVMGAIASEARRALR